MALDMALTIEQTIEEHGLYRKISGTQTHADYVRLLEGQTTMSRRPFRYVILDMRGVTQIEEGTPALFGHMQRAASTYIAAVQILFVGQQDFLKWAIPEYAEALKGTDWEVFSFKDLDAARNHIKTNIIKQG